MAAIARLLMRDQATVLLMVGFLSLVLINILIQTRTVTGGTRGTVVAEAPLPPHTQPSQPAVSPVPSEQIAQPPTPVTSAAPEAAVAPAEPARPVSPVEPAPLPPGGAAQELRAPEGGEAPQVAMREPVAASAPASEPATANMVRPADAPPVAAVPAPTEAQPAAAPQSAALAPDPAPKVWRVQVGTYLRAAPGIGAPRVVRILPGVQAVVLNTVENGDGSKWHEIETDYGKGFLPAFAIEASPRDKEFGRPIFGLVRGVIDSATIEVGGRTVRLFGIVAAPGPWTDQFRDRMLRDAPTVTCITRGEDRYRCITEDLVDLAELLLLNGAARSEAAAPDVYLERELDAQKANRGVWKR